MSGQDEPSFAMPKPADKERRLTPAEIAVRKRARWDEARKACSFLLIVLAFFLLPVFPYFGLPLVPVVLAFLIWPKQKSESRRFDKDSQ